MKAVGRVNRKASMNEKSRSPELREQIRRQRQPSANRTLSYTVVAIALAGLVATTNSHAEEPTKIKITDRLPYAQQPIDYLGKDAGDAVAQLNMKLESGSVKLRRHGPQGYLVSLLKILNVPVESQVLVYSKTAVNQRLINPKRPRALYFNDEVSIGWVPGTPELEVMAVDPHKGAMFYVLPQDHEEDAARLRRNSRCLACHAGQTTIEVPGFIVRSFQTDRHGKPIVGYSRVTHATPLANRWGGWYVTGTHGTQSHVGNLTSRSDNDRHKSDPRFGGNVTDLKPYFDTSQYLSPHSDIVAHLVLNHQSHGLNLLFRVGLEHRLKRRSDAEEQLLRYLLFLDESPLNATVSGTSKYAEWFERQGPRDTNGRSLRQFDLKTRLFKYRLSYLIYTSAFNNLPSPVKSRLYGQLWQALNGTHAKRDFNRIPANERRAIREIMRATKSDLSATWKK